jgi:SAM-dependent methyltransferase
MPEAGCRFCGGRRLRLVVDLGTSPLSNAFLTAEALGGSQAAHPLRLLVCEECHLVQLEEFEAPDVIFDSDYAYFSSFSDSWLQHASRYADDMTGRLALGPGSLVLELASNDGYLLQYFANKGVPVLGVEPAANVAAAAQRKGIPTEICFFGSATARRLAETRGRADLVVGNNVLAHVPDINDFVEGLKQILKPEGTVTMEFPHLLRLLEDGLFDTIYHEHFSYLSLTATEAIFRAHGLTVTDVDEIPTHGGSLRIYARHAERPGATAAAAVEELRRRERERGLASLEVYEAFGNRVREVKRRALEFLVNASREGKRVVGYGAPAKATTFLNYCGIGRELIAFTVDRSPQKQGRFIPGVRVPIHAPEAIDAARPDYVVIFPWNLTAEITAQMSRVADWGGRFVQFIPELRVL